MTYSTKAVAEIFKCHIKNINYYHSRYKLGTIIGDRLRLSIKDMRYILSVSRRMEESEKNRITNYLSDLESGKEVIYESRKVSIKKFTDGKYSTLEVANKLGFTKYECNKISIYHRTHGLGNKLYGRLRWTDDDIAEIKKLREARK